MALPQYGSRTCLKDSAEQWIRWQEGLILAWLHHRANHGGQDLCVLLSQVDSSHGGHIINVVVFSEEHTHTHERHSFVQVSQLCTDLLLMRYSELCVLLVRSWTVLKCKFSRPRRILSKRLLEWEGSCKKRNVQSYLESGILIQQSHTRVHTLLRYLSLLKLNDHSEGFSKTWY